MKNPLDRPGASDLLATMKVGRVVCFWPRFPETPARAWRPVSITLVLSPAVRLS